MRSTSSWLPNTGKLAALYLAASTLPTTSDAANTQDALVASPNLDLSGLGRVAIAGDFDTAAIYTYQGQTQASLASNGSQSLFTRQADGTLHSIGYADAYIQTMCSFVQSDGTLSGVVVGGNFTSLGGVQAQGIAMYNPNTSAITALPGLSGRVASVYCDSSSGTVYVGGAFTGGNSTNAIAWVSGWTQLPFAGFNGPVTAITEAANGNIVFAGDFAGLGNASTPRVANDQAINVGAANVTAVGTTSAAGFSDPKSIICKTGGDASGNTWLLADNTAGSWSASFGFGFIPTLLRLYNTNQDGRGSKTFRFIALPSGGIMNLTYVDSEGQNQSCTARCPLPQGNSSAQDFQFVNHVGMNAFHLNIDAWYGAGGGLSGLELYQDDIFAFAVPQFNEPTCSDGSIGAASSTTGTWQLSPSGESTSQYLTTTLANGAPNSDGNLPSVVFKPDIKQSGNYSVTVYTPGCLQDSTCAQRGIVNIAGTLTSKGAPIQTSLYQTNNYDKYDQIYYGYIDVTSNSFRPTVTLTPQSKQDGPLNVVAQRIGFELLSSDGGLNGLFEYKPGMTTTNTDFSSSAIDAAGISLDQGADVNALATSGQSLYVAGNFTAPGSTTFNNILSIGTSNATALPNSGLDNAVATLYQNGSILYAGGNFTSTADNTVQGLNGVAAFDTTKNVWSALGAGVNGTVSHIVPLQVNLSSTEVVTAIAISGDFAQVNAFNGRSSLPSSGFALWVPTRNDWYHNVAPGQATYTGQLVAQANVPGSSPLYAGSLTVQNYNISDIVGLTGSGQPVLQPYGIEISAAQNSSQASVSKRDTSSSSMSGVVAGRFYAENGMNLTILVGHFTAPASSGSAANLLILNNTGSVQTANGLPSTVDPSSTFLAVDTQGTLLFAGGSVSGTVNGDDINGLVLYNLATAAVSSTQPPALAGSNVSVNAIATQPNSGHVFIGGNFEKAGSLGCATLCYYDTSSSQWNSPGNQVEGVIETMFWSSATQLYFAGNLTVGGNTTTLAMYDIKSQNYTTFSGAETLPGAITALTPASSSYDQFWAAGTATVNQTSYLSKYDGSKWIAVAGLGATSVIRSIQMLSLTDNHDSSTLVDQDRVLMVAGALDLPDYGRVSAALFNGTTFTPFILTGLSSGQQGSIAHMFVDNPANLLASQGKSSTCNTV